ncbi:MAG TPA: hypothetical protein VIB39_03660 [Candidatus Angelobacter sp.]|jgi:uncharacterized iron-regulated membrane protein
MAAYKEIAITLLCIALPVGLAIALLIFRDRRTLRPGMSAAERRRAIRDNSERTTHWWHLIVLAMIFTVLALNLVKTRQQAWQRIGEAAIAAFLVFRYYRKRSEESIHPHSRGGGPIIGP